MELLLEPWLPFQERLGVNMILAGAVDDWHDIEAYRLEAEGINAESREQWPIGSNEAGRWPRQELQLRSAREGLDFPAQQQATSMPPEVS